MPQRWEDQTVQGSYTFESINISGLNGDSPDWGVDKKLKLVEGDRKKWIGRW